MLMVCSNILERNASNLRFRPVGKYQGLTYEKSGTSRKEELHIMCTKSYMALKEILSCA